jgi:hypothetical protein
VHAQVVQVTLEGGLAIAAVGGDCAWQPAALNPKLLVVDLLLIGNRRPIPMFVCFMLGGIGLALAIGLVDVFLLQADAIKTQGSASAGLDLALGIPLVAAGALLASGRLHRRQRQPHPRPADKPPPRIQAWAQRVLHEPKFALAIIIGAAAGTPGGEYILALHGLVTGNAATAVQAADVVVFVVIEFALVIIPFAFLVARPEGVKAAVERFKVWLIKHALQVVGAVALVAGGYMVISGVLRLS